AGPPPPPSCSPRRRKLTEPAPRRRLSRQARRGRPLYPRSPGRPLRRRHPMLVVTPPRKVPALPRGRSSIPTAESTWPRRQCPFILPSEVRKRPKFSPLRPEEVTEPGGNLATKLACKRTRG